MVLTTGLLIFSALLIAAAVSDVRSFRIPNALCLALAVTCLVVRLLDGQATALPMAVAAGAVALVGGFAAFSLRVWGGGDAKLLAAVALWTGFAGMPRLLMVTAIAGGIFALVTLIRRGRRDGSGGRVQLPYGVAIALGGLDWGLLQILGKN